MRRTSRRLFASRKDVELTKGPKVEDHWAPTPEEHEAARATSQREVLQIPTRPQPRCLLLTRLPFEVRMLIYTFVLQEYCLAHDVRCRSSTCRLCRHFFVGRRYMDYEILRTCRAIYAETWHLPNRLREQVFWMSKGKPLSSKGATGLPAWRDLMASRTILQQTIQQMRIMHKLPLGNRALPGLGVDEREEAERRSAFQIESLLVVTSWNEVLHVVANIFRTPDSHPQRVTLLVRHHDWCGWRDDQQLALSARWLEELGKAISPATREVMLDLETIERKLDQLKFLVAHVSRYWFFRRSDGVVLYPDATEGSNATEVRMRSSKCGNIRWWRDETGYGEMTCHAIRIPFRERKQMRVGAKVSPEAETGVYDVARMSVRAPGVPIDLGGMGGETPWIVELPIPSSSARRQARRR